LDRGVGANEPNRVVIKEPVLTPNQFTIHWSQDGVKRIQGQAFASNNPPSQPFGLPGILELYQEGNLLTANGNENAILDPITAVNNLQSPDWVQAFDVYNDGAGNFIVTKVGDSHNMRAQPSPHHAPGSFAGDDEWELTSPNSSR
jgi:hypothetical protein